MIEAISLYNVIFLAGAILDKFAYSIFHNLNILGNIFMMTDGAGSLNVYVDDIGGKTLSDKLLKVEEGWLLQWQILIMRKKKE
jgi:hypothetical protein